MYFTSRQLSILRYVRDYLEANQSPPTIREIARHAGVTAPTILGHLKALERKGAIRRIRGARRGIELGSAPSDRPAPADPGLRLAVTHELEGFVAKDLRPVRSVDWQALFRGSAPFHALRVIDDSLTAHGVRPGDILVVTARPAPDDPRPRVIGSAGGTRRLEVNDPHRQVRPAGTSLGTIVGVIRCWPVTGSPPDEPERPLRPTP